MRVLRFLAVVIVRAAVAILVFPLAIVFLGFAGLAKFLGQAWSDS